ncbi:MAG: hypothetical protein V4858_04390 [Pseudomonadota bacterium]
MDTRIWSAPREPFPYRGKCDLAKLPEGAVDDRGLTKAERIEMLVNRNFVTTDKPHDDLWPYDDTFSIRAHTSRLGSCNHSTGEGGMRDNLPIGADRP